MLTVPWLWVTAEWEDFWRLGTKEESRFVLCHQIETVKELLMFLIERVEAEHSRAVE